MIASTHPHVRTRTRAVAIALIVAGLGMTLPATTHAAATIVILNTNAAGVGFNDATPAAPVGGNPGTTLGQQRLNAFQEAANIWGATLNSAVTIVIDSAFVGLTCTATSAVLGSATPISVRRNFPNAPFANTWYHIALGNALAGDDPLPLTADIQARFNINLGTTGCLTGVPFYLGLDGNHGPGVDLVAVLLHEFGHGLGFSTTTSGTTGNVFSGSVSAYDHFLLDTTTGLDWVTMTPAQRVASAINTRRLVWTGPNVTAAVPIVLQSGTPELAATAPAGLVGTYLVGPSAFGPPLTGAGTSGQLMPVVDQADGTGLACTPLSAPNTLAVNGKIALIDRGTCTFPEKVKNAQNAGAIGVLIADNVAGSPPPGLGGADPTIVIPSVRITQADGATFKSALRFRSRTASGVFVTMRLNLAVYSGADPLGRALMYTPNPFQGGSSVSHWDTIMFPNQLMEPAINGDLTHSVILPQDMTFAMLRDLGWNP